MNCITEVCSFTNAPKLYQSTKEQKQPMKCVHMFHADAPKNKSYQWNFHDNGISVVCTALNDEILYKQFLCL